MYKLVEKYKFENLEAEVNELMADGWMPQGGICVYCTQGNQVTYAQAMVKVKSKFDYRSDKK